MRRGNLNHNVRVTAAFSRRARSVVVHGHALKIAKTLPTSFATLVVTSPPYNVGMEYECKRNFQDYLAAQEPLISELWRILKSNGSICWQVGNFVHDGEVFPLDVYYYNLFKAKGFRLRNRIIWHFGHGLHCSQRFSGRYETILWFTKGNDYTFNLDPVRIPSKYPGKVHLKGKKRGLPSGNPLGKNPSDLWTVLEHDWANPVWEIPNVKANHPEKTFHPCQFPVELVERCVIALTKRDDWVYDPYCGVGSTLIAALKHSRRVVGSDWDARYISECAKRIQKFSAGTLKLRPLGKPIHQPTGREKVAQRPVAWDNLTAAAS